MKWAPACLSLVLLTLAFPAEAASARPTPPASSGVRRAPSVVRISGRDYTSIGAWASANGLTARWLVRNKSLQATNRSWNITFTADSRGVLSDATINGVEVKLLFPLVPRDGTCYLAQSDAINTFQPVLRPPVTRAAGQLKTICLDPGHGGKDPGFQSAGHNEKTYTLLLAQELRTQLMAAGFNVFLTRTKDKFVELEDRASRASEGHADLFVSLHFNAFPGASSTIRGAEVYCLTPAGAPSSNGGAASSGQTGNANNPKNMLLAYQLQKSLIKVPGVEDRGLHRARFVVLKEAAMPAALVESGYMSHPIEGKQIYDPAHRQRLAKAIVDGILAYKRLIEGK